ncbi:hypothetical protein BX070DRAFT_219068 [Coemansia spiralis]|nr:hypothetical protein BX070DRAFT_219068 [Coemansia spiralis]
MEEQFTLIGVSRYSCKVFFCFDICVYYRLSLGKNCIVGAGSIVTMPNIVPISGIAT